MSNNHVPLVITIGQGRQQTSMHAIGKPTTRLLAATLHRFVSSCLHHASIGTAHGSILPQFYSHATRKHTLDQQGPKDHQRWFTWVAMMEVTWMKGPTNPCKDAHTSDVIMVSPTINCLQKILWVVDHSKLVDREVGSPRGGRSTHLLCDRLTLLPISMLNGWCLS